MLEMNLPFRDAAHESFFEAVVAELGDVDDHTKMPVYLLSATQETRDHFYDIYLCPCSAHSGGPTLVIQDISLALQTGVHSFDFGSVQALFFGSLS